MLKQAKRLAPTAIMLAFLVAGFSSCASQETGDGLPAFPESEAALLDGSEAATPVSDTNPSVFADLAPAALPDEPAAYEETQAEATPAASSGVINDAFANLESNEGATAPAEAVGGTEVATAATPAEPSRDEPFYNPIGGEKLGHVAYILYGSRAKVKALSEQNPGLDTNSALTADQKVSFRFADLRPRAKFLTKDLLNRYPAQLAGKVERAARKEAKMKTKVEKGETLQSISQRLYGTSRYWAEIYLLNQAAINNYDMVMPGTELTVIARTPASSAPAPQAKESSAPAAPVAAAPVAPAPVEKAPEPVSTPEPVAAAPVPAPVAEPVPAPVAQAPVPAPVPADPIPETPAPVPQAAESPAFPAAQTDMNSSEAGMGAKVKDFLANSANVRRLIYVIAILMIGVAAFFLTRTKKKSFDMLDMTTHDTAPRPKLRDDDRKHG